ncbi:hypothetical protein Tco_1426331 [Tanacetum coccineum]
MECRKPKRVKDYAYHKEKMMLCKQEEKGVLLSAEQDDWLQDNDEEPDEQELEAHYMYMAKIQEVLVAKSGPNFDAEPLEKIQKQLRKVNATLTHGLNECKSALVKSNDIRDRCKSILHHKEVELEKYKVFKNCQLEKEEVPYDKNDLANIFAPNCDATLLL